MPITTGQPLERAALEALHARGIPASLIPYGGTATVVEIPVSSVAGSYVLLTASDVGFGDYRKKGVLHLGFFSRKGDRDLSAPFPLVGADSADVGFMVRLVERILEGAAVAGGAR